MMLQLASLTNFLYNQLPLSKRYTIEAKNYIHHVALETNVYKGWIVDGDNDIFLITKKNVILDVTRKILFPMMEEAKAKQKADEEFDYKSKLQAPTVPPERKRVLEKYLSDRGIGQIEYDYIMLEVNVEECTDWRIDTESNLVLLGHRSRDIMVIELSK